jgi:hypothetical protein
MNLNDIIQAAQGGEGVANLGAQFGLTPEQTQAAVAALMPAFSTALQRVASDPSSLAGIVSHLASGVHQASFTGADPAAATANGGAALSQIFGSSQIAAHASSASGVDAQTIQQMMPAVASMLLGGLAHSLTAQGFGGVLGQLTSAVEAPAGQGAAGPGGGLVGMLGSLVGNLFGGQSSPAASGLAQAGLTALTGMLQSGVQTSAAHQQGIDSILQSLAGGGQR